MQVSLENLKTVIAIMYIDKENGNDFVWEIMERHFALNIENLKTIQFTH